jgi:Fe-Mn family superoxide dismutase
MPIVLPPLPYPKDALEPHISAETIEYHYGKHHQAYVNNLNNLIQNTDLNSKSLVTIIREAADTKNIPVFNNAAQVWNHSFYWNCLSPIPNQKPSGDLENALIQKFGDLTKFQTAFTELAIKTFGSGWAWLVYNTQTKQLELVSTSNAETPLTKPQYLILLTCDVWEHAYYIDYRNARPDYLKHFWALINWSFVDANFQSRLN